MKTNIGSRRRVFALAALGAATLTGCLASGQNSVIGKALVVSQSQSQSQTGDPNGAFDVIPTNGAFVVTGQTNLTANLASTNELSYQIKAGPAYSGKVQLSVEYDEVKVVDVDKQIALTITPSVVTLSPNQTVDFKIKTVVGSMAPDLALHYHVLAREFAGALRKETELETTFAVVPVIEITITPGNTLNAMLWSTDRVDPVTGVGKKQPLAIAKHAAGVQVRFVNKDLVPHIVHGSGGIPHQNTRTQIKSTAPGGVNPVLDRSSYVDAYVVNATTQTSNAVGNYYSHDKESGAKSGSITFNSTAKPVPVPGSTTGDPTATFSLVNAQILLPSCLGCHNAGTANGGVDVSSHANVIKTIVIGDASISNLYTSVLNDSMPTVGTPLTANQKDMLKRWINTGALNN